MHNIVYHPWDSATPFEPFVLPYGVNPDYYIAKGFTLEPDDLDPSKVDLWLEKLNESFEPVDPIVDEKSEMEAVELISKPKASRSKRKKS